MKTVASQISYERAVSRYLRDLEIADRSPRHVGWLRQKLSQLQRATAAEQVVDLDRDRLLDFIKALRDAGRSPAYVRGWYQVFRGFFGWCRHEGYQIHPSLVNEQADHWFTLKKPAELEQEFVTYDEDDIERILQSAVDTNIPFTASRNRLFIRLLAGTGLRLSEALSLTLDDLEEDRLRVRMGKGRKSRWVPLPGRLQRELSRYVEKVRPDATTEHLFLNRSGGRWSNSAAVSLLERISRETGIRVHAHAFRHTYATNYLRNGGEIDRLRRILGHTTFKMTSRYVHMAGVDLGRGIDDLVQL